MSEAGRTSQRRSRLEKARARMYHDLIFESAEHVFAERGFEQSTMQEIAAEAGVSLKTLYATFPGKSELYAEINEARGREFVEHVLHQLEGSADPLELMAVGVRAYVDFLLDHRDFLRIHLQEGRAWGLRPAQGPEQLWREGVDGLAGLLRDGMARGVFHQGDAELLAMTGIAIMQVQLARLADAPGPQDAGLLADEILVQLQRLFCREPQPKGRAAA